MTNGGVPLNIQVPIQEILTQSKPDGYSTVGIDTLTDTDTVKRKKRMDVYIHVFLLSTFNPQFILVNSQWMQCSDATVDFLSFINLIHVINQKAGF